MADNMSGIDGAAGQTPLPKAGGLSGQTVIPGADAAVQGGADLAGAAGQTPLPKAGGLSGQTVIPGADMAAQGGADLAWAAGQTPLPKAGGLSGQTVIPGADADGDFDGEAFSAADFDESPAAPFTYLENEQNLNPPAFSAEMIDDAEPLSGFQKMGKWLRQAADWHTYWEGAERIGAEAAAYKYAYDEGKFGEFDAGAFGKEMLKAGGRSFGADNLRMAGNVLAMFGTNLAEGSAATTAMTAGAGRFVPEAGKMFQSIGSRLKEYGERLAGSPLLAPAQAVYDDDPNWIKVANVLGQGSAQVLAMGAVAKFIGAAPAYGLFAGGGAGEIFSESYAKDGDADTAAMLALLSGGTSFAIDRLFNPLPRHISGEAKATAKMIAREMAGAPLREAGAEVLQQMLAENLVRQAGIDATQDLFEGLLESALGAVAGATALNTAGGGAYLARKSYEDARRRLMLKGVAAEDIELAKSNMLQFIQSKPEAFGKVLGYSLQRNLDKMAESARELGDKAERQRQQQAAREFKRIYKDMYERSLKATGDKSKAKIAAGLMQANAMALFEADPEFSPAALTAEALPQVRQEEFRRFAAQKEPSPSVMFQFAGTGARHADFKMLKKAQKMEKESFGARIIWAHTGWYRGVDGRWRFEINDSGAKLKNMENVDAEELPKRYWQTYIRRLEELEGIEIQRLRSFEGYLYGMGAILKPIIKEKYNYLYGDFIDFLDKHYVRRMHVGKTRKGLFEFRDLEGEEEGAVKTKRELADSRVRALAEGYDRRLAEARMRHVWSRPTVLLRDMSPEDVLINRGTYKILDGDGADLPAAANEEPALRPGESERGADGKETRGGDAPATGENQGGGDAYRPRLFKRIVSNDNRPGVDSIYGEKELKLVQSIFEEAKYLDFLENVWKEDLDRDTNYKVLVNYMDKKGLIAPEAFQYEFKIMEDIARRYKRRKEVLRQMGMRPADGLFSDFEKERLYRIFLAGHGDYHRPNLDFFLRPDFYREVHLPVLMSDRFLSQERYRFMTPEQKRKIGEVLDRVYRIYRLHRETEYARAAEQRDVRAANAYAAAHFEDGNESLRRYWTERQLLLERRDVRLGDLLDHPELYKNYPELEDATVRFTELDNNDGYHFYRDKEANADVLEIDPRQFDYSNLKELLLRGTSFAIQMRENFDLGLSPTQQKNFMDRQVYLIKKDMAPEINQMLTQFLRVYLPGEKQRDYLIDKEVPLPLLHIYRSEASGQNAEGQNVDGVKATYREVDYDKLYAKLHERYGMRMLDPDERAIGNLAYAALQDMREEIGADLLMRARAASGYRTAAPFPWSGLAAQGTLDVRATLRRQDYSDWQRTFSYWDEKNLPPPSDRTRLSYADLEKTYSNYDENSLTLPDMMRQVPDNEEPSLKAQADKSLDVLAKGAYDAASKTLYLFETADAETIVHETFHYLSGLFKSAALNNNSRLRNAYFDMMDDFREQLMRDYDIVHKGGKYFLQYREGRRVLPDIPRRFDTPGEALDNATEELFVQHFMFGDNGRGFQGSISELLMADFYLAWLDKLAGQIGLTAEKSGAGGRKLLARVEKLLPNAVKTFLRRLKITPEHRDVMPQFDPEKLLETTID